MESGEFKLHIWKETPIDPPKPDHKGQLLVMNHDMLILDPNYPPEDHRHEVARVHRFITREGFIGASGKPDPKEITLANTNYREIKRSNPHCMLCEEGDMIPAQERFYDSWYRPEG